MPKKIFLSPSNQDKNTYAAGNTTEDVQCGKIAQACKAALERCGFEVKLEQYDTMQNRVAHSNAWGADLHVPIHTNAFDGKTGGTRVFFYSPNSAGYTAAKAIYSVLSPLTPGKSDNLTQNASLYELKCPKAPSVYVEAEFHDVSTYAKWIIDHTTQIGEAICNGICAYFGVTYKYQTTDSAGADKAPAESVLNRVQVGAFKDESNAAAFLKNVKAAGFTAYAVKVGDLFKIQIGAFSVKANADAMVAKAKAAGFDAFITPEGGTAVILKETAPAPAIKVGSTVKVKPGARTYTNQRLASFVYNRNHKVTELVGDRAVISFEGTVIAAVRVSDLVLIS